MKLIEQYNPKTLHSMKKIQVAYAFAAVCLLFAFSTARRVSETDYKQYAGVYSLTPNGQISTFTVTFESEKLYGQADGYDKTQLTKQVADHTFQTGYGSTVVFVPEAASGKITGLKLTAQGTEIMGTKQ